MFFVHDFYVNISCIHRLNGSWCSVRALLIEMVLGLPLCILCMTQIFSNARLYLKLKTTTYVLLFLSIFSAKASFANKPTKVNFFYSNSSTIHRKGSKSQIHRTLSLVTGFQLDITRRRRVFSALTLKLLCGLEAPKRSRSFLLSLNFLCRFSDSSSHFILPKKSNFKK